MKNKLIEFQHLDILQTLDGDRVVVLKDKNLIKVLSEEELISKKFNENEGFFMDLDNFIKYNSFYYKGNYFDFERSNKLNYEKSRGFS